MNPLDWRSVEADPCFVRFDLGLFRPKKRQLGADFAGLVVSVGAEVEQFFEGDEVFGSMAENDLGSFAEYAAVHQNDVAIKPSNVSFDDAATLGVAAQTAFEAVDSFRTLCLGDRVLVNGASGGVGTFAVQLAKLRGAHVTAVSSERNHALLCSLGVDHVLDYQEQGFSLESNEYDFIIDAVGNLSPTILRKALREGGTAVVVGFTTIRLMLRNLAEELVFNHLSTRKVKLLTQVTKGREVLEFLGMLLSERCIEAVIDRSYGIDETHQALEHQRSHRAKGKIILRMQG
jgi:NADPH:quinone reductase-like Zn-dependent oxidoreductase